jgi:glycogen phosphorylase
MWQSLWPDVPVEKVPIDSITNGVHVPTWVDQRMGDCLTRHLGQEWLADHDNPVVWELVEEIRETELWDIHLRKKIKMIGAIREWIRRRWLRDRVGLGNVVGGRDHAGPQYPDHRFCPPIRHL